MPEEPGLQRGVSDPRVQGAGPTFAPQRGSLTPPTAFAAPRVARDTDGAERRPSGWRTGVYPLRLNQLPGIEAICHADARGVSRYQGGNTERGQLDRTVLSPLLSPSGFRLHARAASA
jgi:hypothetical protein